MRYTPLIFLIPGAVMFLWPDFVWQWTEGWRFKDVEPSDLAIKELQVRGAFFCYRYHFRGGYFVSRWIIK